MQVPELEHLFVSPRTRTCTLLHKLFAHIHTHIDPKHTST